jgi:NAD(P)-dependent dehydrogenase (short-subunit alcohol dehydrogenase family)
MGFGAETTVDEVLQGVDLGGKTALMTGANSGIGLDGARALAAAGARVVVTAKDRAKVDETLATLRAEVPGAAFEGVELELASLASVRAAADRVRAIAPKLDMLIANAGIMFAPFGRTADGFESQFGVDHLGHFVFVCRLAPSLLAAAPARVVSVSSSAHMFSDIRYEDPNWERTPYEKFLAYSQAKTANILFALALDKRLAGRGVRAFSCHPGGIRTNLMRFMDADDITGVGQTYSRTATGEPVTYKLPLKTIPQGAATSVWGAVSPELDGKGGLFLTDCQIAPPGTGDRVGYMPYAVDPANAERLWSLSEQMVGERFDL